MGFDKVNKLNVTHRWCYYPLNHNPTAKMIIFSISKHE
ncbi:MAG: hypothetical protein RLZZ30_2042 [Bacteroidota bacterium]|jgi:hypothetical protein